MFTRGFPLSHWFLTQVDFCPQGALDNIWRQFWLLQLGQGGISWEEAEGGAKHPTIDLPSPSDQSVKVEEA